MHEFVEVFFFLFCKIWMPVLQIVLRFICMTVSLSLGLESFLPKPQPPTLSLSHPHTNSCTPFTLIGIDIRTVPPHLWRPLIGDEQLGPAWPIGHANSTSFFFFLFRGGGGWGPLVKWIKIPNNGNNNDNKKLLKNGMFLPDCAGVVVFNYAIFIGILIIFSTNKPPLIKAKHG